MARGAEVKGKGHLSGGVQFGDSKGERGESYPRFGSLHTTTSCLTVLQAHFLTILALIT